MTSSSTLSTEFYFHLAVIVIGVVGTAANALILYALVASKQHKKHALIVNQNALDLFSCIFLVIVHSVKLCDIRLTGWHGYLLCVLILSDNVLWWGITGSIINLAIITIERYLKVVRKNNPRSWMIHSAMALAWIGSIAYCVVIVFSTSTVVNGVCHALVIKNESRRLLYFCWNFVAFYVIILLIFVFCYGRILFLVRRQANVMAGHAAEAAASTYHTQMNHIQTNLIKTMILVCGFYAVMWLPNHVSFLILISSANPSRSLLSGYYVSVFFAFLYVCANPFIYATKFDPVKQVLLRLIPCKKTNVVNTG